MYLVAIAWIYVVLMMAVAEALSSNGSLLGAVITFVLYGALPLSIVLYVMGAPSRRKARRAAEAEADAQRAGAPAPVGPQAKTVDATAQEAPASEPAALREIHAGSHPAGAAVAPVGKEP